METINMDPYGAVRVAATRYCRKDPMAVGTVVIRRDTEPNGRRRCSRYIKIRNDGPPGRRWILYSRWWWEKNRGPVPPGHLVLHKDGDTLNDEPKNLMTGTCAMKFVLAHKRDAKWSKDQHVRAAAGCAEWNRRNGRVNRARNFLKNYWYPVVDDMGVILNIPFRRRKRVLACFGIDVSGYPANGHGKKPASKVQRALRASRVRPVRSQEFSLRRYSTYCILDPASMTYRGPMDSVAQLVAQLERMEIWQFAEKQAKKDLCERK
jgi:hypothetical protein